MASGNSKEVTSVSSLAFSRYLLTQFSSPLQTRGSRDIPSSRPDPGWRWPSSACTCCSSNESALYGWGIENPSISSLWWWSTTSPWWSYLHTCSVLDAGCSTSELILGAVSQWTRMTFRRPPSSSWTSPGSFSSPNWWSSRTQFSLYSARRIRKSPICTLFTTRSYRLVCGSDLSLLPAGIMLSFHWLIREFTLSCTHTTAWQQ